jgi:competence protein ComEA
MKNGKIIIFLIVAVLLLGLSYYSQKIDYGRGLNSENNLSLLNEGTAVENLDFNSKDEKDEDQIVVHLAGAVKNAGVYKLNKSDRLVDLIKAAGGLKENADLNQINLAEKLYDGQKFTIPLLIRDIDQNNNLEISAFTKSENNLVNNYSSSSSSNLVNINQADQSDLEKLSGIGPAKAAAIIKYRKENSYFSQKDDLLKISGIGEKTLENIKDEIVLQ